MISVWTWIKFFANSFYKDEAIPTRCPTGFNFDVVLQVCSVDAPCQICPTNGTSLVPQPDNCRQFYMCVDGEVKKFLFYLIICD